VAAADCDGGAFVRQLCALIGAAASLTLTACATYEPVSHAVATTLNEIEAAPASWDGKWVRVEGRFDYNPAYRNNSIVDGPNEVTVLTDEDLPADLNGRQVILTARVDARCFAAARKAQPLYESDRYVHISYGGELEICNSVYGVYLDTPIVKRKESAQ